MPRKILILTCGGTSERFKPFYSTNKAWLTHPSGNLMAAEALRGCYPFLAGWEVVAVARPYEKPLSGPESLRQEFERAGFTVRVSGLLDPPTTRAATVREAICCLSEDDTVCVRDCDNHLVFDPNIEESGAVVLPRRWPGLPQNVSGGWLDGDHLMRLVEHAVDCEVDAVCAGAYIFKQVGELRRVLQGGVETMTQALDALVKTEPVKAVWASAYEDWGSGEAWHAAKMRRATLFVDLDGLLLASAHRSFGTVQGQNAPHKENVIELRRLASLGAYVVVTTAREERLRQMTVEQLSRCGIPCQQLVMSLPASTPRVVLNDKVAIRGERTAIAVEVEREHAFSEALAAELQRS